MLLKSWINNTKKNNNTQKTILRTVRLFPKKILGECPGGNTLLGIDAYGYMHLCLNLDLVRLDENNLLKRSITDISNYLENIKNFIFGENICLDCELKKICGKGCRGVAFKEYNLNAPDPLCEKVFYNFFI
ncbi:MAG: SPASM domain-containing protein [Candidatus Helarchaeota archaeon]